MNAKELWGQGDLKGTIAALTSAVKSKPTDGQLRTFLFEALSFDGALDRAAKQLDVLATQASGEDLPAVQQYRALLLSEDARRAVFAGTEPPTLYGMPPDWLEPFVVLPALVARDAAAANAAFESAAATAPAFRGSLNGEPFASISDVDDRTPLVLEIFREGQYAWLPFSAILRVEMKAPERLRDLLWASAEIETRDGHNGGAFLPVLYANTHASGDDAVRLGRSTTLTEISDRLVCASGQRLFNVDGREVPLLAIRTLEFAEGEIA
jgi:type VI secretion system protein ImpE